MTGSATSERIVVRYSNRKLYDTHDRRYVTLDELRAVVAAGTDVTVRDKKTGRDISSLVLGQVLVDTLKRRTASLPKRILQRIITLAVSGTVLVRAQAPTDGAATIRREAERIAAELISKGRLGLEDAAALRASIVSAASRAAAEAQRSIERRLGDLVASSEREHGVTPSLTALKDQLLTLESSLPHSPRRATRSARVATNKSHRSSSSNR